MGDNSNVVAFADIRSGISSGKSSLGILEFPFISPNVRCALGKKGPRMTCCILRVAWALVMQKFRQTDEICFVTTGVNGTMDGTLPGDLYHHEEIHLCRLSLSTNVPVRNMLKQAETVGTYNTSNSTERHSEDEAQGDEDSLLSFLIMELEPWSSFDELKMQRRIQKFDLSLRINLSVDNMRLSLYYQAAKFSHWQGTNLAHSFYEAVQGILMQDSGNIADIQVFGLHDQVLLDAWRPAPMNPVIDCLHSVISAQARKQPLAPALCSWETNWNYAELDNLSTRVAHQLSKFGIQAEVLVPLYFEKSAWAIVAMLAVLKAGGAFVALDPQQPLSRLQSILKQLNCPVLLTSAGQLQHIPDLGFPKSTCIVISENSVAELNAHDTGFVCSLNSKSPAYVIFTSGSTGEPKGVVVEHEAICTSCTAQSRAFEIQPGSRVLQFSSYAFDACIGEIFTTLLAGGCVCVPSDEERNNVADVCKTLGVNFAKLTPTLLNLMQPTDLPGVQTILSVGENLTLQIRDKWAGHVKLLNGYGPAECSVDASSAHISPNSPADNIGHAMEGSRLWVVDALDATHLAPVGCAGELYIEGPTLARGYLNDSAKTQAAFLNDLPWIPRGSSGKRNRVYKTGDFVQYNANGTLKFLGRRDMQVKIHGQRVELGEIEFQLRAQLSGIQSIFVELGKFGLNPEEPVLVAFLTTFSNDAAITEQQNYDEIYLPLTDSLRIELSVASTNLLKALPRHMVPLHFVSLRHMPLNSSGKLDRKALRQIVSVLTPEETSLPRTDLAPQDLLLSDMEHSLQSLWAEALRISPNLIGSKSNFFMLGGNSMSVIRLLAAARGRQVDIKAADVFQCGTLRELAACASPSVLTILPEKNKQSEETSRSLLASLPTSPFFSPVNIEDINELTDVQKLLLFYNHLQPSSGFMRIKFAFDGNVDVDRLETACRSAVYEHQILRTVFVSNGARLLQVLLRDCPIDFRRLTHDAWNHEIQLNDSVANLETFGAPIARFVILESESQLTCLVMQFSHVQYDAFSIPCLVKSIHAFHEGTVCQPAPKFTDFLAATLPNDEASERYWKALLTGSTPTELKSQSRAEYSFVQYCLKIQLASFVSMNEYGITTPSIIKAAWWIVLAHLTGQEDVIFGEVVAGRNAPVVGIDCIVGPCFNIIPVRVRQEPRTCLDLLRDIEQQHIRGIPHENFGTVSIIERCTAWPKHSRLSSAVNYRTSIDSTPRKLSFGGATAKLSFAEKLANFSEIVLDTAAGKDGIYVNLAYENGLLSSSDATKLLAYVCDTIHFLVKSPNALLATWRALDPEVKVSSTPELEPSKLSLSEVDLNSSEVGECIFLVASIWDTLNLPHSHGAGSDRPFYEARNHFETSLVLRDSYHQIGADLTLEEIMQYPSFGDHVQLVAKGRMVSRPVGKMALDSQSTVTVSAIC